MDKTENRRRFLINFAYATAAFLIIYIILKYLLNIILPFVIAFFTASLISPVIRKLSVRLSLSRRFVSFVIVLIFYATAGTLVTVICVKLFVGVGKLFGYLPDFYSNTIAPLLSHFFDFVNELIGRFDNSLVSEYGALLNDLELSLGSAISAMSVKVVGFISSVAADLPMFVLEIILLVISTFFFSSDYEYITDFILSFIPKNAKNKFTDAKKCMKSVLLRYCRSYLLIMLITFSELSFGLTLARINNPLSSAFIITVLDILPVVGTGLVLIPWGILKLIAGELRTGVLLLIVYAAITIIRNIIEPKIVGKEVGLHPALTLISMFVGTRLFGIVGLFALPLGLSLTKNLNDCGVISLFPVESKQCQ